MTTLHFTKGHGTGNDFVLFADPDGELDLSADAARGIWRTGTSGSAPTACIRAVRSAKPAGGRGALAEDPAAEWFMDYHNADGSPAEMCGNGIRVFARLLIENGLLDLAAGETCRSAPAAACATDAASTRRLRGRPRAVHRRARRGDGRRRANSTSRGPGSRINVGNPHVVVALADDDELDGARPVRRSRW